MHKYKLTCTGAPSVGYSDIEQDLGRQWLASQRDVLFYHLVRNTKVDDKYLTS